MCMYARLPANHHAIPLQQHNTQRAKNVFACGQYRLCIEIYVQSSCWKQKKKNFITFLALWLCVSCGRCFFYRLPTLLHWQGVKRVLKNMMRKMNFKRKGICNRATKIVHVHGKMIITQSLSKIPFVVYVSN